MTEPTFIERARAEFRPGDRGPCGVCGAYPSLTHAHHIVPLSLQERQRRQVVDQRFVWLCPNHHAAVHILIGQAMAQNVRASAVCIAVINDLSARSMDEFRAILELAEEAWK